jgi:hypothetical protein
MSTVLKTSVVDTDKHWFGSPESGSILGMRIRIQGHGHFSKVTNEPGFLLFKKAFVPSWIVSMFLTYYRTYRYFNYIFYVKIKLFVTLKADQAPDSDPHWFSSLDPDLDPHWDKKLLKECNINRQLLKQSFLWIWIRIYCVEWIRSF